MGAIKKCKEKIAKIILTTTTLVLISNSSIAVERYNFAEEESSSNKIMLSAVNSVYVPKTNASDRAKDKMFSLLDELDLRIENQGITEECWAFSAIKSLETNIALKNGTRTLEDFSERHLDYATSKLFIDGQNNNGFNRIVGQGGLLVEALAYLTNGQGAVLESNMPFENNEKIISIDSINRPVDTIVNDYYTLPSISKKYEYDSDGNTAFVKYFNSDGKEYSLTELTSIRNIIKNHLVNNGAIATMTAGRLNQYYNAPTSFKSTAYNCNSENMERDHAFTIIGWDDEYSKDNFAQGAKPSTDGAYIVLNSYGEETFNNGILYVSYEDYFIESEMYGVQSTSKLDYDNIYQTDFYGGIYQIGNLNMDIGYYGAVFSKTGMKNEIINSIGVTLSSYSKIDIYINPNGSNMDYKNLIKVGSSDGEINPGFHRIYINPTRITGNDFAVVIKQQSADGTFSFAIETPTENSDYSEITSENNSFVSMDGYNWENLADVEVFNVDMKNTDVCIKVFSDYTDEEFITISSDNYQISENYIKNIRYETNVEEFKRNLHSNSEIIDILENDELVEDGIIKSGMKLKLSDGKEYTLIVRGDITENGRITLTDFSKLILHYNEVKGFGLRGNKLESADMDLDGRVTLVDVSQFLVLYNSL